VGAVRSPRLKRHAIEIRPDLADLRLPWPEPRLLIPELGPRGRRRRTVQASDR
jgi:hypothetical protein